MRSCGFYCVANAPHFPGAVALLNSLRLLGHHEPFTLVDAGLTDDQRDLLSGHVELLSAPADVPPVHLAPYGPRLRPADVQVVLDADVIAVRPLTDLIDAATAGCLVGFVNDPPNHDRFFPEWADVLGLGSMRQRAYLNAGQFVIPGSLNARVLGHWIDGQETVGMRGTRYGRKARLSDPFYFADQDVVNALLSATLDDDELDIREHRLAPHPPFRGLRLIDSNALACAYPDRTRPYFLHHTMGKPWLQATRRTIYSTLLSRLLLAPDVTVRLDPRQVPLRLRPGRLGSVDLRRADIQARLKADARRRLGTFGIRTRLADRRRPFGVQP
ncbi:hypothetical protein [Actinopolymorpha rutila]|uniref:Uncharacterized protein n=1 Tax=Actinopolymorpha rutila TaxID=446787 RepID=A0A852ZCL1_9ACTN|nr:hypothetical protein [Actinopolymorpha rutila]NYH90877.1 hypothetical protein [Actinopolymorpha rutila]